MTTIPQIEERNIEIGEFWTARQRQAHKLHYVISYRAAFKPELPEYFINRFLKKKKQTILDPFGGRGTTILQANLDGHFGVHNDINPLSIFLAESRKNIPKPDKMEKILNSLDLKKKRNYIDREEDLLPFFHKDTLTEIINFKEIFRADPGPELTYLALTALSRLHGHSGGFFSVYTFPQISIPPSSQKKNNEKKGLFPEYRPIVPRILKKMRSDLKDPIPPFYHEFSSKNRYTRHNSGFMETIESNSIDLVVTSPPFLDKVDYIGDNWLKAWFLDLDLDRKIGVSILSIPEEWKRFITQTLAECYRVMKPRTYLVMEVGDVLFKNKIMNLDEIVLDASSSIGFNWYRTIINSQKFTKLSNCWNVSNNEKGTNSNRCVVLQKL